MKKQAITFYRNHRRISFSIVLVFFLLCILLLNALCPLISDDWNYFFIRRYCGYIPDFRLTNERIHSIADIIHSQYIHYQIWGGRSVAHFFAQLLLWIGKPYNKLLNSLVYIFLVYLICLHIHILDKKIRLTTFILVNLLIFALLPDIGSDILWLTGSANYLWTMCLILLFTLPYARCCDQPRIMQHAHKRFKAFYMPILGILAGWTNENTSFALLILLVLMAVYSIYKKRKLPLWYYTGLMGFAVGFVLLMNAPGNYLRYHDAMIFMYPGKHVSHAYLIVKQTIKALTLFVNDYTIPLILITFLFVLGRNKKIQFGPLNLILFCVILLSFLVMISSPLFPPRALFSIIIFSIIIIMRMFLSVETKLPVFTKVKHRLVFVGTVLFLLFTVIGAIDLQMTKQLFDHYDRLAQDAAKKGNKTLVIHSTKPIMHLTKCNIIDNLHNSSKAYDNIVFARYHNLDSVIVK